MLETIEVETAVMPNAAVIWLHGLGADGHDFEPMVPEIVHRGERAWRFVFPNAPIRPVTINGGMSMRAWYDLKGLDRKAAEDVAGFRHTDAQIRQLIAREVARGIPTNRIVLAGFSQGGAVVPIYISALPGEVGGRPGIVLLFPARKQLCRRARAGQRHHSNIHGPWPRGYGPLPGFRDAVAQFLEGAGI